MPPPETPESVTSDPRSSAPDRRLRRHGAIAGSTTSASRAAMLWTWLPALAAAVILTLVRGSSRGNRLTADQGPEPTTTGAAASSPP